MFDILDKHGFCCNVVDMTISKKIEPGTRFGRLTVVGLDHIRERVDPKGRVRKLKYFLCKCVCGNNIVTQASNLTSGDTKSCGCYSKECRKNCLIKFKTHGKSHTKLYERFRHIRERCYKKNSESYKYYGGRGIKVCEEWNKDFMSFYNWAISHGYEDGLTIDRIDVNGDYCPENCRWVTTAIQNTNKRNNNVVTIKGKKDILTNWCKKYNIARQCVYKRLWRGWDIESAITVPPSRSNRYQSRA